MPNAKRPTTQRKRKSYAKKSYAKNRRIYRRKTVAPMETACLKQTLNLTDIDANQPYETALTLDMFPRALDVADNYQLYRIAKVEYIYKPRYDTFISQNQPGTSNAQMTVPYLFSKVLNYPAPVTFGLNFLTTMGVKPRRLDDKSLRDTYTPHVLQVGLPSTSVTSAGQSRPLKKPWLNTHVSQGAPGSGSTEMDTTIHYGHVFWVQQEVPNPNNLPVCELDVNVYFEFKKPWDLQAQVPPPGTPDKVNPFVKKVVIV